MKQLFLGSQNIKQLIMTSPIIKQLILTYMMSISAVKQRMQMCCSKHLRWSACAKSMLKEEGGRAFFRSYTTQLSMNIPFQASSTLVILEYLNDFCVASYLRIR